MFNLHQLQIHTLDPTESETSSNKFTWSSENNTGFNSQNVGYSCSHFSMHTQKGFETLSSYIFLSKIQLIKFPSSHFCEPENAIIKLSILSHVPTHPGLVSGLFTFYRVLHTGHHLAQTLYTLNLKAD